ncbi:hypothetical protein CBR_g54165 [Chara braunii]|uniref:Uncharacterized protein n=1 Tax=Chara braunii TaxID=69332 RepID=A0A388K7E6_CHABU|nr:hypothetical protein CBR_g54165 [Chara braunii]|eukprot:GBG65873.1 hypothetical protein CBR_g54165 [Chara braunii]
MNSKGGCQIWLTHLAATHGVDVANLRDKIIWEELTRLWKKRFIVDDAPALAINCLFTMTQGNTATRDWLTEWQKIAATPDLDLPFPHLRREFYNRSCAALSQTLGDREQYATFAEIIDKAREIIKTNRAAAHEKSTWQPTYVEKVRTGPRQQQLAAVQSDNTVEDPAATQASREGDQVAAVHLRSNNKPRVNGKAKPASQAGNGQPAPPWVKFNLTEAEYKYRGRYGCCYWCNSTKHKTSLCQDQAKEDAQLRDYLHTAVPAPLMDAGAEVVDLHAYIAKIDREFKTQRYDDIDAPLLYVRIQIGEATCSALIDCGASPNYMSQDFMGDVLLRLLRLHIQNNDNPYETVYNFSCNIMPMVLAKSGRGSQTQVDGYPSLNAFTFGTWYRVQHEEILTIFNETMKKILASEKAKLDSSEETIADLLAQFQQCVIVHVALVQLTRQHDKVAIHGAAIRYGGKFMDTFLKGMKFLQSHWSTHKDEIIVLVRELQKATRIIQSLCSESKCKRKMPLIAKVPSVKRSMERYVFSVKALLHQTEKEKLFWIGNLKHKDVQGREVSSQVPGGEEDEEDQVEAAAMVEEEEEDVGEELGERSDGTESAEDN